MQRAYSYFGWPSKPSSELQFSSWGNDKNSKTWNERLRFNFNNFFLVRHESAPVSNLGPKKKRQQQDFSKTSWNKFQLLRTATNSINFRLSLSSTFWLWDVFLTLTAFSNSCGWSCQVAMQTDGNGGILWLRPLCCKNYTTIQLYTTEQMQFSTFVSGKRKTTRHIFIVHIKYMTLSRIYVYMVICV